MNVERKNRPDDRGQIIFHLPKVKKIEAANGLKIWFVKKTELPVIQMSLICSAGSKFDDADKKGLSYLTSMMIDEGAGEFNALELDDEFESMGTILKISADHDSMFLNMLSLSENFDRSLELFSKVVLEPKFEESDFLREQKKLIDKITQLSDEPSYLASTIFEKILYRDQPYSFPTVGYGDHISKLKNVDLQKFHSEYFVPSNCDLVVVGNIEEVDLLNKINDLFSNWVGEEIKPGEAKTAKREKLKLFLVDKKDAAQSEIRIGHIGSPRNSKDFYSKVLLNTILGGQFSSRINLNLREDKGYTYGANSSFGYNRSSGYFAVSTSVQTENTGPAVSEILKELDGIRKEVLAEELEFAKSYLIKRFPSLFETSAQIASHISAKILYSLPNDYYDNYISNIENTNLEEVSAAAINNIFPDELAVLIVGDKNLLYDDLGKLLSIEVNELNLDGRRIN
jgi:zinc protease